MFKPAPEVTPAPGSEKLPDGVDPTKVDEGLVTVLTHSGEKTKDDEITVEQSRRVLRKLDTVLMPMMCVCVLLQFLDKSKQQLQNLDLCHEHLRSLH